MSRLMEYIERDPRGGIVRKVHYEEVVELLKGPYSKAWRSTPIWRDMGYHEDAVLYDGSKEGLRKSSNTRDYYTLVINNEASWSRYPKRKLICSTESFSRIYRVVPMDGVRIGVCSAPDIWDSFKEKYMGTTQANWFNQRIERIIGYKADRSLAEFKKACKKVKYDRSVEDMGGEDIMQTTYMKDLEWMRNNWSGDFYKTVVNALEPGKNGFKLAKAGNKIPTGREVWIDGKALLLSTEMRQELEVI